MKNPVYETLSEAVDALQQRGYRADLSLSEVADCLICRVSGRTILAEEFQIDEVHRFEGDTDPADETVVYAVSSIIKGIKGLLIDAYGAYADPDRSEVIAKLHRNKQHIQQPLKRAPALQPLSREHHHTLLLCWKIKLGLSRKIEVARLNAYVWFFWKEYLQPHFQVEESRVFPELGNQHPMVQRALNDHKQIESLFNRGLKQEADFSLLETMLEGHIRFEERVLFPEMQLQLLPEALGRIAEVHRNSDLHTEWPDEFWK